ncbi:methyl-CpG-binding domain-containing protein 9-like [Rutidosis leptorrhynchoides]|uniref:methyl-CpG-binding domain-containing protein 9-like n=1 Tax=Rutidosis leptorrhynchoides TaxID=125765 RepID=UPI003A99D196
MENMKIPGESSANKQSFPHGSLIGSNLSYHTVGNLLEVHDFLCRFKNILGLEEPISFEEFETELCNVGKSSILETVETFVYNLLLPELVTSLVSITSLAVKVKLDMIPVNQLTWPEVVRRYITVYLLTNGRLHSLDNSVKCKTEICRSLLGDGDVNCSSVTSVEGVNNDVQLLGRAMEKFLSNLKKDRSCGERYGLGTDVSSVPEWVKVLEPVKNLPTNVGSRIRKLVNEALEKNPPEWAKGQLEASISKDVYKGNASGPTKTAVKNVIKQAYDGIPQRASSVPAVPLNDLRRRSDIISNIIMKTCRSILHQVAAQDIDGDVSYFVARNIDYDAMAGVRSVSTRPLDLRTIDSKLLHGAYGGSHEAFFEDVGEVLNSLKLWMKIHKCSVNKPSLIKLANSMSKDFKSLYEKEVIPLCMNFSQDNMSGSYTAKIEELEKLLKSIDICKAPWENKNCKVCGLDENDESVLLCDGCNAEYHIYCLNPPLSDIPEGDWHCPKCIPKGVQRIKQYVDNSWKEAGPFFDILTDLEETEFWDLEADKKIVILKFLFDESLNTTLIHDNFDKSTTMPAKEFLGIDFVGRLYWGFPKGSSSTHSGIVVDGRFPPENTKLDLFDRSTTHPQYEDCCKWHLFESDKEIDSLVDYLTTNDPENVKLINSILGWQESILHEDQQVNKNYRDSHVVNSVAFAKSTYPNCPATKATVLLEAKYGLFMYEDAAKSLVKAKRKKMVNLHRCDCLEPVFSSRYHCVKCHETFFTDIEFGRHKSSCSLSSLSLSVESDMTKIDVGSCKTNMNEPSLKLLKLNAGRILSNLKKNMLDMEAALPNDAIRLAWACPEWRAAWRSLVKSASTTYEMVEATLLLENMIKSEYINNAWWWYWSSPSVAEKTPTLTALAFRIYTLDAAINYNTTTLSDDKQPPKRR